MKIWLKFSWAKHSFVPLRSKGLGWQAICNKWNKFEIGPLLYWSGVKNCLEVLNGRMWRESEEEIKRKTKKCETETGSLIFQFEDGSTGPEVILLHFDWQLGLKWLKQPICHMGKVLPSLATFAFDGVLIRLLLNTCLSMYVMCVYINKKETKIE